MARTVHFEICSQCGRVNEPCACSMTTPIVLHQVEFLKALDKDGGDLEDFGCAMLTLVARLYHGHNNAMVDDLNDLYDSMCTRTRKKMKKKHRNP